MVTDEDDATQRRAIIAFWFLGVLNNSSFVIMLAAATNIEEVRIKTRIRDL
jgi:hypothetical protein